MGQEQRSKLQQLLDARYADAPVLTEGMDTPKALQTMAARKSVRGFTEQPVPDAWLDAISAIALAAPTKSDLQQRDIIVVKSPQVRARLADLAAGQIWIAQAPMIIVFCGNNRRQRLLHKWQDVPFANDHLDAFFNAVGDAAIALGAFVTAAEALGLGCCPISAVRNEAAAVSELLGLPAHVFPFAGLAIGFPAQEGEISKRLPLQVTCHVDQYCEDNLQETVAQYDTDRAAAQPYCAQRGVEIFGISDTYGWSDDKARQYSQPERTSFGSYVRAQGFNLD